MAPAPGIPTYDDGTSAYHAELNRNTQRVGVDLAAPPGRELLLRLLTRADVLVENFNPGVMERWGGAHEAPLRGFPRLSYCRVTAVGHGGSMGGLPGYAAVVQAYSGIIHLNGETDGPPVRVSVPVTDLTSGLPGVTGVLLARHERASSGRGRFIDRMLFDSALSRLGGIQLTGLTTSKPRTRSRG